MGAGLSLPHEDGSISSKATSLVEDRQINALDHRSWPTGPTIFHDSEGKIRVLVPAAFSGAVWSQFGSMTQIATENGQAIYEYLLNSFSPSDFSFFASQQIVDAEITDGGHHLGTIGFDFFAPTEQVQRVINVVQQYFADYAIAATPQSVVDAWSGTGSSKRDNGDGLHPRGCSTKSFDFRPYINKHGEIKTNVKRVKTCAKSD